jgi:predicted  nucleic acid-binding Zn-ribbon protein
MLKCDKCGGVYHTPTPELFLLCKSCGGNLEDITTKKKGGKKITQQSVKTKKREYAQSLP